MAPTKETDMAASEDTQITCRFSTKLPEEYRVPATEIAVPAKLTRYGLSQVINHLIGFDEPVPFDFLVNGELVRLSLAKLLLSQGTTAESVLEVEYILAVTPPDLKQQLPHDDWVSALDGSKEGVILSGCYEGILRVWSGEGAIVSSTPVHQGPISSLASLPDSQGPLLVSGGKLDHVIRLLQLSVKGGVPTSSGASPLAVYRGHTGSVLDVAAAPSGDAFVSASQDKSLRIWPTGAQVAAVAVEKAQAAPAGSKKKQRLQNGDGISAEGAAVDMIAELAGHSDGVTAVAWSQDGHIYSGSMDHSVKKWDPETGINVDTHNSLRAISSVDVSNTGRSLVAFAGAGTAWSLWDPRQRHAENSGTKSFSSHSSHIHQISWHRKSEEHLVTASMDKTLKLWDLRTSIPLHTLDGHTQQVLCGDWWEGSKVISGSADSTLRIYQTVV